MIKIKFEDFEEALEGKAHRMSFGVGLDIYLDTVTGEVVWVCDEFPDHEEIKARIESGPEGRYLMIEPLESYETFKVMERFAEEAPSKYEEALFRALRGPKPFGRFNGLVHSEPELKERWFKFREAVHLELARDWLRVRNVPAKLVKGSLEVG